MKFDRVRLENFKCYEDADLRLDSGVTVVHGPNGAGKSSLLEACFFALYGHRALQKNLDEVVTIGAEEARIELWFGHAGREYHLERAVRVRGETAQTTTCVLEGPDETVEGATDVRKRVTELLRMDSEAFVNCAYVRQGEVNKLIQASPGERQDMIDDLLQLGKLEEYRERASEARVGVQRVRNDKEGALSSLEEQIAAKEEKGLHERLNGLRSELNGVTDEIETLEAKREPAEQTRKDAEAILEEHREAQAEIADLEAEIADLEAEIREREQEREAKAETLAEHRSAVETLTEEREAVLAETELDAAEPAAIEARTEELETTLEETREAIQDRLLERKEHTKTAETARERAAELEEKATEKREEAADREADLEADRERLSDRREKLSALEERIEDAREAFADAPVALGESAAHKESVAEELTAARESVAQLEATLAAKRETVAEAEALLAEGKCPECGQPVEESPHVESVDEDREALERLESDLEEAKAHVETLESRLERAATLLERENEVDRLESELENLETLIEEQAGNFAEREAAVERLRERASELDSEAAAARERASEAEAEADELKTAVGQLNAEQATVKKALERLERLEAVLDDVADHEAAIERLSDRRESLAEQNDLRREQLSEKRERKRELAAEFDGDQVEHARTEKERAERYLEQVDAKLETLRERRDELQGAVGAVENELDELESLRERRDDVAATVDRLQSLYDEAYQLQEMYADLRAELRQRNVKRLESLLNETFELVYQNDSYANIELGSDYDLTVYQKDGEPLDPDQLSGGERALFNLSLRCAIYRLLAEGIEGETPMPPLILDEPTVFLDSGHVTKLVELVETMRGFGVEQIVVVSHDEELFGAADQVVVVEKDATSNRSSVTHEADAATVAGVYAAMDD